MDCNTAVTVDCNDSRPALSESLEKFYNKCKTICEKEQREFTYRDFLDMKPGTFRQNILRIKPYIEKTIHSGLVFYKIKGIKLPGDSHLVTVKDTRDTSDFIKILESTAKQPVMIHDVKIKIDVDIHSELVAAGRTVNFNNQGIQIKQIPITDNNIVLKASVYPHTVQLDVACTYKPIIYDVESLLYFSEILAKASMFLTSITLVTLPPVNEWIITHYHLNKDGSFEINGKSFHFTISDVTSGMIRFYSKKMGDGRVIPRIEQIQTPKISITEVMKKVVGQAQIMENHVE
jgi:hypothetical protein